MRYLTAPQLNLTNLNHLFPRINESWIFKQVWHSFPRPRLLIYIFCQSHHAWNWDEVTNDEVTILSCSVKTYRKIMFVCNFITRTLQLSSELVHLLITEEVRQEHARSGRINCIFMDSFHSFNPFLAGAIIAPWRKETINHHSNQNSGTREIVVLAHRNNSTFTNRGLSTRRRRK